MLMGTDLPLLLAADDEVLKVIALAGGIAFAALLVVARTVREVSSARAREETRREIAAYVAEGSMTTEQGERLLAASPSEPEGSARSCGRAARRGGAA